MGRRGAGLRTRLLVALLATSAVTLLVAALALLSPLQDRLKRQAADNLQAAVLASRASFQTALNRAQKPEVGLNLRERRIIALSGPAFDLRARTNSRVVVTDALTGKGIYDTDNDAPSLQTDALRELRTGGVQQTTNGNLVTVAVRVWRGEPPQPVGVLLAQKPLTDATAVVKTVRNAFLVAALAGLAVALLLGTALATTLSRRLARLRTTAARIAREGPDAPAPRDSTPDEIGDLARSFATMQDALRRQEDARRSFVSTASHELRTPLTTLQWTLELLADDLADGRLDIDDAQRQVASAQVELRRLGRLASELLDLSRLDAEVELRAEAVELGELCRAVAAEFEARAGDQHITLDVVPPLGPCWGRGDPGAIARIARILLDNALRFAPPGTAIRVIAAYHGERATLEIADAGPGVAPDECERIFKRFQRGSETGGEGGFGLGLAIGRELAERQGGQLDLVAADHAAPGAHFRLSLPIEMPAGSSPPRPQTAATG